MPSNTIINPNPFDTVLNIEEKYVIRVIDQAILIKNVEGTAEVLHTQVVERDQIAIVQSSIVQVEEVEKVIVKEVIRGIVGPRGAQGIQGPRGYVSSLTYSPPSAQQIWHISHNLGHYPFVVVEDSAGQQYNPDVRHIDLNTLEITFAYAIAGTATMI